MPTLTLRLEAIGDDAAALFKDMQWIDHLIKGRSSHGRFSLSTGIRRPWVAEITGTDDRYGVARRFLDGKKDYSEANSVGSRGVYIYYHLREGLIYEVYKLTSWKSDRRFFCTVSVGKLLEMTREEVDQELYLRTVGDARSV